MTAPRFHTERTPGRPTAGGGVAVLARLLGVDLMPWQQRAADVILEIDPATGRFTHREFVVTVPRQAGKTTLVLLLALHRALYAPGMKVWYTAQTGQAAREKFNAELAQPALASHVLRAIAEHKRGAGDTRLNLRHNGSQIRPHPPNDSYLHGEQGDLNLMDEVWDYTETKAAELIQAIKPTHNTRPNAQMGWLSTMGTARSTWWHRKVDEARAGVPGVAIIDYGIPLGGDPTDLELVAACHPAIGHTTDASVLADADMSPGEFARAFGNVPTKTTEALVADSVLDTATIGDPIPEGAPFAVGAATSFDRSTSAVVVVAEVAGRYVAEVVDTGPGVVWAAELVDAIVTARRPVGAGVDPAGPSGRLADECSSELRTPTAREIATATDDLLARVTSSPPSLVMRHDDQLRRAWRGASLRNVAETGRVLSRSQSVGSIAPLEALLAALWVLTHPTPTDEFVFTTTTAGDATP